MGDRPDVAKPAPVASPGPLSCCPPAEDTATGSQGANFYELAYEVVTDGDTVLMPALRTGDRELGPLVAVTFGGGARYDFGPRKAYGIMLSGDVVYTKFLNHLFVVDRYGYFGALGFEAKFE